MNMITSSPMLMEIVRMSLFLSLVRRLGQDFVGLVLLVDESAFLTECSGKGDENDDDVSVVFSFPLFEYRCFIPWPRRWIDFVVRISPAKDPRVKTPL